MERDAEVFQLQETKNPNGVPLISREDVFGPSNNLNSAGPKDFGVVGDGRKKNSSDFDSSVNAPQF